MERNAVVEGEQPDSTRERAVPTTPLGQQRNRYPYDAQGHMRVGHLRLAHQWMKEGATYQAISAYGDILTRYGGMQVAEAATEDLLSLARALERDGRVYAALGILKMIASEGPA